MLGIFKKKTKIEKLQKLYKLLMNDAYKLQSISRTKSDKKYAEADEVLKKIESLQSLK